MTDREKIKLVKGLLLGAYESEMIGNDCADAVGYVNGILDACIEILSEEDADEQHEV